MIIIGIDPGLFGAVALINSRATLLGKDSVVFDIPTMQTGKTTKKNEVDCRSLYLKLEPLTMKIDSDIIVCLEQVNAMPGQGVSSMFSMGHTLGAIKGVIASLGFELHMVTPQKWKKHFGLNKDKELSRSMAIRLFPSLADSLNRKKDADRAEALLIARWYQDTHGR